MSLKDLLKSSIDSLDAADEAAFDDEFTGDLRSAPEARRVAVEIPTNFKFDMYWMGTPIGELRFDGDFWQFAKRPEIGVNISEGAHGLEQSNVPFFVESLMPETWTSACALPGDENRFDPNCGDRYLSNIVIRPSHRKTPVTVDRLEVGIEAFSDDDRIFRGSVDQRYMLGPKEARELSLRGFGWCTQYAEMLNDVNAPRMSGAQNKLPAFLSSDGLLTQAKGNAFTHILKFPNGQSGAQSTLGSVEWFVLSLLKKTQCPVEDFALVAIEGFGPVLAAERFDVLRETDEAKAVLAEDFCSAMSIRRHFKDRCPLEAVMQTLSRVSSNSEEDCRHLLRQVVFSWMVGNEDLHLKNLTLLKVCDPSMQQVESLRLAPAYDIMNTQFFSSASQAALPLFGHYDYNVDLFVALGELGGIPASETRDIVEEIGETILDEAPRLLGHLPDLVREHRDSAENLNVLVNWMLAPGSRVNRGLADAAQIRDRPTPRPRVR